jgi:MFS family permease
LSFFTISAFLVIDALARVYGLRLWGNLADKFGAKPTLTVAATVTSIIPLAFIFINRNNYLFIPLIFMIAAIAYAGVDIAIAQVLFKSTSKRYSAYYFATFSSITGVASAVGPVLGGTASLLIKGSGILTEFAVPLKYVFLLSFILRVLSLPMISRISELKAYEVKDVMERIRSLRFVSFFTSIYSIASYTSKIVLVPQKQLFMIQRKTFNRLKKDVSRLNSTLSKLIGSLGNISKKNIGYYRSRLLVLDNMLKKNIESISYMKGSKFISTPAGILKHLRRFESKMTDAMPTKKDIRMFRGRIEASEERLEKQYNKEIGEKINK